MSTFDEVVAIIHKVKQNQESYDLDIKLVEQGLDSLDMIDVLFQLQDTFSLEIPEDIIESNQLTSIGKIVAYIEQEKV